MKIILVLILVFFAGYNLSETLDNGDGELYNLTFVVEDDRGMLVEGAFVRLIEEWNMILEEDFGQDFFPPEGWARYQLGGADTNWERCTDYFMHGSASACNDYSVFSYLDNWLVTPQIESVPRDLTVSLWQGTFYKEKYNYHGIWISTGSGDPNDGDFVELMELDNLTIQFLPSDVSLAEYEGEDIYIAFVYRGLDADRWYIDTVYLVYPTAQWGITDAEGTAVFGDLAGGVYYYRVEAPGYAIAGGDVELSGSDRDIYVGLTSLANGIIVIENPDHAGIYRYRHTEMGKEWEKISSADNTVKILTGDITGNGIPDIIVLFGEGEKYYEGLYVYDIYDKTWTSLGNYLPEGRIIDFTLADTGESIDIIISCEDRGIWQYSHGDGMAVNIAGSEAELLTVVNLEMNGPDKLVAVFLEFEGIYIYDSASGSWNRIVMASPSVTVSADITGNRIKELVCVFEGLGTYIAEYDSGKGSWNWHRITWATPDEGHRIGCANIDGYSGEEVFLVHQGSTYYYSYKNSSWHTFIHAPLNSTIYGKFTHVSYSDIIASESMGGNLYLYSIWDDKWQIKLHSVYSGTMAVLEN